MEPATVIGLVTALVETYADGRDDYAAWRQKRSQSNHYRGRGRAGPPCALSTLLAVSGPQIKGAYAEAVSVLGTQFSTGDASCRSMLWAQLNVLSDRVANLHRAAAGSTSALLDIADAIQVCEAVRRASLHALAEQYRRIAAGRPLPKTLTIPRPEAAPHGLVRQSERRRKGKEKEVEGYDSADDYDDHLEEGSDDELAREENEGYENGEGEDEDDRETTAMTVYTGPLRFQSEPPSPPPTPKTAKADLQGTDALALHRRPANSVFALFCPEALSLQVDPKRPLPDASSCSCGYRWRGPLPDHGEEVFLKEGFKLTRRFLAKSHLGRDGYACVFCTSSGKSETYDGVGDLSNHINVGHTKWQLLHDTDCCASQAKKGDRESRGWA